MKKIYSDDLDFEDYIENMKEESGRDHRWLTIAAFLLGSKFVLDSFKPKGPVNNPTISKPVNITDISGNEFKKIIRIDIEIEKYSYIFPEKELNFLKQLNEELKHHGRLEDPRTIENTALRWTKQKNELLSKYGSLNSHNTGILDVYKTLDGEGFRILIPWTVTGKNPCKECLALDGELFDPEGFPGPPHFHCHCNDPMADPILISDQKTTEA